MAGLQPGGCGPQGSQGNFHCLALWLFSRSLPLGWVQVKGQAEMVLCEGKGLLRGWGGVGGGALVVCWLVLAWELGGLASCPRSGTNGVSTPAMVTSIVGTPTLCLLNRGGA